MARTAHLVRVVARVCNALRSDEVMGLPRVPVPPTIDTVRTTATVTSRGTRLEDEDRLFIAWVRQVMSARRLTHCPVAMLAGVSHSISPA